MPEDEVLTRKKPPEAGTFSGPLLIVGTARGVIQDVESYWGPNGWNNPRHDMMAVSQMGCFLPKMRHWYSAHHERMAVWQAVRTQGPMFAKMDGVMIHATAQYPGAVRWGVSGHHAPVSGMIATVIGLELGYAPVILAGIPQDGSGHFYPCEDFAMGAGMYWDTWKRLRKYCNGRVRSLSGYTREVFGAP